MLLSSVRRFSQWLTSAEPAITPPSNRAELRIKRADAQNLLQQLQQDMGQLEDDLHILEVRYHELIGHGRQRQAEMVLQQIADIEQSLTLKSNRASEIAEIAQLLQWDEIQQATDFVHAAYSPDLQQTQHRMAEQIARQSVRRNQLYDLAHMVKDSEADQARMMDAGLDALRARLARHTESASQPFMSPGSPASSAPSAPPAPRPPQPVALPRSAAPVSQPDPNPGHGPNDSIVAHGQSTPPAMDDDGTWCAPRKPSAC